MDLSCISIPATIIVSAYAALWLVLSAIYLLKKKAPLKNVRGLSRVSVVVPARNEETVIIDLLKDLEAQTWKDLEVIVVAHNCSDNTASVAIAFAHSKPNFKVLELKTEQSGKALALEKALQLSTGSVFVIFDADNRVPKDFVEKGLQYIKAGYDGVQAKILSKNPNESLLTYLQTAEFLIYPKAYCEAKHILGFNSGVGGTGIMLTRKAVADIGGFHNMLIEDYDILVRLTLAKKKIAYGENIITYDEKVKTWRGLIKQRARWLAGYFQMWQQYSWKNKLRLIKYPVDFLYFFNPLCILALITNYSLSFAYFLTGITFWSMPLTLWIGIITSLNIMFTLMLRKDGKNWKSAIKMPWQVTVFGFHWFVAFFYAFKIKGWTDTKTTHGN